LFVKLDDIENLTKEQSDGLYKEHYNWALYELFKLSNIDIHFEKAEGINLWDKEGNKYLDFTGGFGSLNLGHNPPKVINALKEHFGKPNLLEQGINVYNGVLGNNISYLTDGKLPICSMTNCGTETVEEALKLAFMYKKKGVIVYCSNAYHGKTLGSISALGNKSKENYPTFDKFFEEVPFGDIDALSKMIRKHEVAAFLVEPIQGEGGIVLPPEGYFGKVRALCDEHDIVMIIDEIQTGLGRCGTMFYYEQLGIVPDILCLSKSLSGGLIPVGCIAVKQKLWDATYRKLKNATLTSSTFGGNTLASIAAIESLTMLKDDKLYEKAKELGDYALKKLNELKNKYDMITDIRGKGLFIGIEFGGLKKLPVKKIVELMMSTIISKMLNEHRIICGFTTNNPAVMRFEPPLIVTQKEIDCFINSLDAVLSEENGEINLFIDSVVNTSKGLANYQKTK
jgi:putrescine aminotransferase